MEDILNFSTWKSMDNFREKKKAGGEGGRHTDFS